MQEAENSVKSHKNVRKTRHTHTHTRIGRYEGAQRTNKTEGEKGKPTATAKPSLIIKN